MWPGPWGASGQSRPSRKPCLPRTAMTQHLCLAWSLAKSSREKCGCKANTAVGFREQRQGLKTREPHPGGCHQRWDNAQENASTAAKFPTLLLSVHLPYCGLLIPMRKIPTLPWLDFPPGGCLCSRWSVEKSWDRGRRGQELG